MNYAFKTRSSFLHLTRKSYSKGLLILVDCIIIMRQGNKKRCRYETDIFCLAGAIRIELISLVLETKAQPLYQTPKQRAYYITKKTICQLFFDIVL